MNKQIIIINSSVNQTNNVQKRPLISDLFQQLRALSESSHFLKNQETVGMCEKESERVPDLMFLEMPVAKSIRADVFVILQDFLMSDQSYQDYLNLRNDIEKICKEEYSRIQGLAIKSAK
ncbi:hypothetical protein ACFGYG_04750 [Pasteurella multocida]|nr:hypothetical protein [Pasteurella multocida]HDR1874059.1 hypothetical protein [Pasteurella multocida]HDR1894419.1 hypothetical protein [Pasteurella multocida]HED4406684.1 hypothetical protein [Pasteurella multocida]